MARKSELFVVTIDGRAYESVFTTIKGITKEFPELPYSTLREAFAIGRERIYVAGGKVYRVSLASISRVQGRGGHLNKTRA